MDTFINPSTRDYDLSNGTLVRDAAGGLENSVYLRLMTPLGSYWADPALGSRLHELQREKDVARVARQAQQYAEQALSPLLAAGRVQSIAVSVLRQPGRLMLTITIVVIGGTVVTFNHPVTIIG